MMRLDDHRSFRVDTTSLNVYVGGVNETNFDLPEFLKKCSSMDVTKINLLKTFARMYVMNSVLAAHAERTIRCMSREERMDHSVYLDSVIDTLKGCDIATANILQQLLIEAGL